MGKQSNRKLILYLPLVALATFLVVAAPMLLVLSLRMWGVVSSVWAGMIIGVVVSFLAAYVGGAFWKTRTDSRDILFSELMLWGWVLRWRSERRLSAAADVLGLTTGRPRAIPGGHLGNEQKADLLTQLTSGLEARDPYTHGHSRRVARHASNIAKRMGLPRDQVAKIRAAGAMHDVGKVETPIAVLHKEGKLTDGEYAVVKRHPVDGAVMVSTLHDDELTAMVRHHHERLDGTGYPDRLVGEAIPVGARIIAVADTFDAITSTRPYRHAHAHKKALNILVAEAGTQLDPDAVRAFSGCYSGRRPLAYWTILANSRPRLASLLGGGLGTANAGTMANVMATAATAAVVGSAALGPLVEAPKDSPRMLGDPSVSRPASTTRSPSQESRRGERPAPQTRRPQHTNRRDQGSTPIPADTMPVSAPSAEQDSGVSPDPSVPHNQPASFGPGATPMPGNRPVQDEGQTDTGQDDAGGQDKGGGEDNGQGQGNGQNGNGNGNGQNGQGNGQNGQGNTNGHGQGPVTPAPGSSPGQGNGEVPGGPSTPGGQSNGNRPPSSRVIRDTEES